MATKKKPHWEDTPNTSDKAKIIKTRTVKSKPVIEAKKAQFRDATFSGVFEIADVEMPFRIRKGKLTTEIICLWHGKKPLKTWAHITLGKKYKLIHSYTGEVAADIGSPAVK